MIERNKINIKILKEIENKTEFERGMLAYAHAIKVDMIILVPKEKQVIEDAFIYGQQSDCSIYDKKVSEFAQDYYNTKYNNQIK